MIPRDPEMRNLPRDVAGGTLLIVGALAVVVVMSLHPTGHELMAPEGAEPLLRLNVGVHGLALASVPAVFLGLLGLSRRLGSSDLTTAALVVWAFGGVAVTTAAVASGLVATEVIERSVAAEGARMPEAFLLYTGLVNHGFAKVYVVAGSVAILLWSAAILRTGLVARAAGAAGAVVGAGVLLGFFSGHLRLAVHGFGIVALAQSGWLIWVGVLLCRGGSGGPATRRR